MWLNDLLIKLIDKLILVLWVFKEREDKVLKCDGACLGAGEEESQTLINDSLVIVLEEIILQKDGEEVSLVCLLGVLLESSSPPGDATLDSTPDLNCISLEFPLFLEDIDISKEWKEDDSWPCHPVDETMESLPQGIRNGNHLLPTTMPVRNLGVTHLLVSKRAHKQYPGSHTVELRDKINGSPAVRCQAFQSLVSHSHGILGDLHHGLQLAFVEGWSECLPTLAPIVCGLCEEDGVTRQAVGEVFYQGVFVEVLVFRGVQDLHDLWIVDVQACLVGYVEHGHSTVSVKVLVKDILHVVVVGAISLSLLQTLVALDEVAHDWHVALAELHLVLLVLVEHH